MPLDSEGYFTIVMSWPEDRPGNATMANGVKWLNFGSGEGRYLGAQNWVNLVYMRYQHLNPDWSESPANIPAPTSECPIPRDAEVMKEYYHPRAKYTSKTDFEGLGDDFNAVNFD